MNGVGKINTNSIKFLKMNTTPTNNLQKVKIIWASIENLLFIGFAATILYVTVHSFIEGSWKSFIGMGYLDNLSSPIQKKIYYQSVMALLSILTTFFLLVEMIRLFIPVSYTHLTLPTIYSV